MLQMKLLTGKTTLAGWTKVLSRALINLNDQPVGPVSPYARLGTPELKCEEVVMKWGKNLIENAFNKFGHEKQRNRMVSGWGCVY